MHLVAEIALSVLFREACVGIDHRDLAFRHGRPFGVSLDDRGVDECTLFYQKPLFIKLLTYGGKQFVKQLALAQRLAEAYESGLVRGLRIQRKAAKLAE